MCCGGDKGCRPFPRTPFSASGILPPLRSGQVSLDEAEHFTSQSSCQRRYAPMVFGIIPECRSASLRNERSASPESPVSFPKIPGVQFPPYMPRNWRLDFGPEFGPRGIITREPPGVQSAYTVLVPQVDADGNDLGGIRLPEVAVPLGTFTGWNYELPVISNLDYLAGLRGSFIPFSATSTDRRASGDVRLSISERYESRDAYLGLARASAQLLVSRRFLRSEDIDAILEEGVQHWDILVSPGKKDR